MNRRLVIVLNWLINLLFLTFLTLVAFSIWNFDISKLGFWQFLFGWVMLAVGIEQTNVRWIKE